MATEGNKMVDKNLQMTRDMIQQFKAVAVLLENQTSFARIHVEQLTTTYKFSFSGSNFIC